MERKGGGGAFYPGRTKTFIRRQRSKETGGGPSDGQWGQGTVRWDRPGTASQTG